MIYVNSLNGNQVEPLINISDDFKMEQSVDGTFTVSFTCFSSPNNVGYSLLRSESKITVEDNEFIIKQYNENIFSKSVVATSVFFENSKVQRRSIFSGNHTLRNHLDFALAGIDWEYTADSDIINTVNYIENLGDENIVSIIEKIVKAHAIEYQILPNNRLHFAKELGPSLDYQYRYKYNVSDVVMTEDSSNLYTVIRGYGADGLEVAYTSPNVSIFGVKEKDSIRDDRFTNAQSLMNYIKNQITDVPEMAIESKTLELTERSIGEKIWFLYEPLNIEMQTRILKQTKVLVNDRLVTESVVFGNTLIKTSIDILVEQKQEIEDNKDYINETNSELTDAKVEYRSRFEVTDQRITLEVEQLDTSIAAIDIKTDNINLSVNNRITNEVAAIDIRANQIALSVQNLDNRTSSSISLLENNINLKIDKGGAITDINLSPGIATINADKINLNGAVLVNGMITGSTSIQVSTDVILGRSLMFSDFTALTTGGGNLTLEAFNNIYYTASSHYFNTENVYINGRRVLTTADL